jgi:hypothetical protein
LIISQKNRSITLVEKEEFEWVNRPDQPTQTRDTKTVYFTDARGELNMRGIEYKTKTKWMGNTLQITDYYTGPDPRERGAVSISEISISSDGNTLTRRFRIAAGNEKERKEFADLESFTVYKRFSN